MSDSPPTVDKLVRVYRKLRDKKKEREEEHKAELAELNEQMEEVSSALLDFLNENNLDNVKTPEGTVSRRVNTRYWTSDWEKMYDFIKEHEAFELLERRIHNANMRNFLDENPDLLPRGLQVDNRYIIQVRKPTS
jgi:hypothetical protein